MAPGQARDGAIETARGPLEQMMQNLADNLEQAAPGDVGKLSTTGFDLRKAPTSGGAPDTPGNLRLRNLEASGDVQFLFNASARAKTYQFQTTGDPNNGPVEGLRSGQQHAKRGSAWFAARERRLGPCPRDRAEQYQKRLSDPATVLVT